MDWSAYNTDDTAWHRRRTLWRRNAPVVLSLLILVAGCCAPLRAGNVLKDVFKAYMKYREINMMLWLAGDAKAEKRFGEEVKWFINLTNKREKNAEVNRWVGSIFNRLTPHFKRRGFKYNITVLKGNTVNAFAIPGGSVFIYKGMLDFVGSDDELAAVLAHELAHSERRHSLQQLRTSTAFQLLLQKAVKNRRDRDTWGQVVGALTLLTYSRKHEYEADNIGQFRMAAAGFNPSGQVTLWEKFVQKFGKGQKGILQYLSTHPPSVDRVKNARNNLAKMNIAEQRPQAQTLSFNILSEVRSNLLKNTSFETTIQQKNLPDTWELKSGQAAQNTSRSVTGLASLALNSENRMRPVRVLSEFVPVSPTTRLEFSAFVVSETGDQRVAIGAEVYDRAKRLRGYIWPILSGARVGTSWQKVTGIFESGADRKVHLPADAAFMRVVLQNGPLSKGTVWFDDLMLRPAGQSAPVNLLETGNFEYAGPDGLPVGVTGSPGRLARDLKTFKIGYAALRLNGSAEGETMARVGTIPYAQVADKGSLNGSFHFCGTAPIKARLLVELLDQGGKPLSRRLVTREFTARPNLWQATSFRCSPALQKEEQGQVAALGVTVVGAIPADAALFIDGIILRP